MTTHLSRADVSTDAPARYAKQLVSHLGRKVAFATDGATSTATVGNTTLAITVGETALTLTVTGPDPDGVTRAEHALGNHLERFGARRGLTVTWTRTTTTTAAATDGEGALR
ncbi:MAG TPA: DUF2218 domain-containing protein [Pseudonocardiaceae bacterium]|nr:DUF2218 domain-containing protein [Pseudonocardiaceae bacterium]